MIITSYIIDEADGAIATAKSDSGRVIATQVPMTTLYGTFALEDEAGRQMSRGAYMALDNGRLMETDERVPTDLWAEAVQLMREVTAYQSAREDAAKQRADAKLEAWAAEIPDAVLDMDQPDSDH